MEEYAFHCCFRDRCCCWNCFFFFFFEVIAFVGSGGVGRQRHMGSRTPTRRSRETNRRNRVPSSSYSFHLISSHLLGIQPAVVDEGRRQERQQAVSLLVVCSGLTGRHGDRVVHEQHPSQDHRQADV